MLGKKLSLFVLLILIGSLILTACQGETVEVTRVVTEKETVVETVVETVKETVVEQQEVEVVVTATPAPVAPTTFKSADPDTIVYATYGDAQSLDPAWDYENAGGIALYHIYDQLITFDGPYGDRFVPELATEWQVSDDGLAYTFNIREGVKFHEGQDLTPEDVAYTFQRGLLLGGTSSPQILLTEPLLGVGIYDIAELVDPATVDDPEALQAQDPAVLLEACEKVTSAIVADDDAGTVTFNLVQPWGPFLATLAGYWGSVIDKEWSIEQGAWDGDCATWQNYYGAVAPNLPLQTVANGSGPYKLDHWTPGEEIVLAANPDYWGGAPPNKQVVYAIVDEWGTRFAMVKAGDTDFVTVDRQFVSQMDPLVGEWCDYIDIGEWDCHPTDNPDGPLRLFIGYPLTGRTDVFFIFDIEDDGGNPYLGSGQLDGNGIPPDFFSDVHIRKAFNYCFDWDTYIQDALAGEAVQNYGPINIGNLGYDPDGPHYSYDPAKCEEELKLAWDGQVWENGFRFQTVYNTGNVTRQTIAKILQEAFSNIDPKFQIELVGLPWPSFLNAVIASRVPMFLSGWGEDYHDPHNWVQPMLVGTNAVNQRLPDEILQEFRELITAAVTAATPEERAEIYHQINQLDFEYAPAIRLAVATGRHYQQRWVQDWFRNPIRQWFFDIFTKQ